ncbi:MAG: conjugal transfer protein TraF [Sphingomonadales bacterium]|nr:conjugal transfer protein TraF [Sphingomonadales bacterium]
MKLISKRKKALLLVSLMPGLSASALGAAQNTHPSNIGLDDEPVAYYGSIDPDDILEDELQPGEKASQPEEETAAQSDSQLGDSFYCEKRQLGQWFYCERLKEPEKKGSPSVAKAMEKQLTASQRVKLITRKLDELRDRAILEPTTENLYAYISYQNKQSDRASKFADVWERTMIASPELDYTLKRPVSKLGKEDFKEKRQAMMDATMASLKERYGVFYFYSGLNCSSCDIQAPIISSLKDNYGLTVMGMTSDGYAHPLFPESKMENGVRKTMGLPGNINPTIALYDTLQRRSILIGSGILSSDEIVNRIYLLTQTKPGEDY